MKKLFVTAAIVGLVAVIAGPVAAAGKGGGSSITLVRLGGAGARLTGDPVFGEQVMFDVSTSRTDFPWVQNLCWQDGRLVYEQWHGLWSGYYRDPIFTLGPTPSWGGGGATCEGRLVRQANGGQMQTLATTSYQVG